MNINNKNVISFKNNLLQSNLKMNSKPVGLKNEIGANICWWNAFAQLFCATRNLSIANKMNQFVNEHDCKNKMNCWYCKIFYDFISMMTTSNYSTNLNFNKYIFNIPQPIKDSKDKNKFIYHPFYVFHANTQQDSFEGCDQWFDVMKTNIPDVYNMFVISTISEMTCKKCNICLNEEVLDQHALSVSINNNCINSIQDAINHFQKEEIVNINRCDINKCTSKSARKKFQFKKSSNYLIVHLKRFMANEKF
jgi:hypothetical protein